MKHRSFDPRGIAGKVTVSCKEIFFYIALKSYPSVVEKRGSVCIRVFESKLGAKTIKQSCLYIGSGKTFTMEGDHTDIERRGMIPRSMELVFETSEQLKEKGWTVSRYT